MGDGYARGIVLAGDARQEVVAGITGLLFVRAAVALGAGLYIFLGSGEGKAERLGLRGNEIGICVRSLGAEAVVKMCDLE